MIITLIGDVALTGIISSQTEKNHSRYACIEPILSKSDIIFANLEAPVKAGASQNEYKESHLFSLPEPTVDVLKILRISCVSLANNHVYDCKMPGLKATIKILEELKILHTGAGWLQNHIMPLIIHKNEQKIAFLAYVDKRTNPATEYFPELLINYLEPQKVISDIKTIRNQVDKLICSLHWGNDYSYYPTTEQRKLAHSFIEAGADIIMGHHSHTLQPFEEFKSGLIFYGLGNLTFGDFKKRDQMYALYRKTKKSAIYNINENNEIVSIISLKENKGNYIVQNRKDILKRNKRLWIFYRIKESNIILRYVFLFKERIIDRGYEYFFGYYMNPLRRIIQVRNIKKIGRLFK